MKLLIVTNDFPPTLGGIENYTYSLASRWPPAEVLVVTRATAGCASFDAGLGFEVQRHTVGTMLPTPRLKALLEKLIKDRGVDAVWFPSALPLGRLGPNLRRPYALTVHGGEFLLASRLPFVSKLLTGVCKQAGLMLAESSFAEELIDRLFIKAGMTVWDRPPVARVSCGVDLALVEQSLESNRERKRKEPAILSVSRLIPRKGPRTLIQSMAIIGRTRPDARLVIVGGGPDLPHLRRMAAEFGVQNSVTFEGPQPWKNTYEYYRSAAVFALPTRSRFAGTETEGLPLVFLEAAAFGLPLVGGDVGGVRDAVRPGQTGFLVDGASPVQTASAILEVLDNPALSRRLGHNARAMVEAEFTWQISAGKFREAMLAHCRA